VNAAGEPPSLRVIMNIPRTLKLAVGALLLSACVFSSAYGPASEIRGDGPMARALRHMDLSDRQVWKIKDIMRHEPAGRRRNEDVRSVLSPRQRERLDEILRHERR